MENVYFIKVKKDFLLVLKDIYRTIQLFQLLVF
jgi:hypothetical protein